MKEYLLKALLAASFKNPVQDFVCDCPAQVVVRVCVWLVKELIQKLVEVVLKLSEVSVFIINDRSNKVV